MIIFIISDDEGSPLPEELQSSSSLSGMTSAVTLQAKVVLRALKYAQNVQLFAILYFSA